MQNFKAQVEEIRFFTSVYGKIKPVIKLDRMIKLPNVTLDGLALEDFSPIAKQGIGVGSTIYFSLTKNSANIKNVKNRDFNTHDTKHCPTCGSIAVSFNGGTWCANKLCPSIARSGVFGTLKYLGVDIEQPYVSDWLNSFPINTETEVPIYSIYDFIHFTSSANSGSKNTLARMEILKKLFGDNAEVISKLETMINDTFSKPMTTELFLNFVNLVDITENDKQELIKMDYINLISNPDTDLKFDKTLLSEKAVTALMINSQPISTLLKKYSEFTV